MKKVNLHYTSRLGLIIITILCFQLSSRADLYPFSATYSGANEVPANGSPGTGTITGVYNDFTNTIHYTITFSGLSANVSAAHFHGPALPGVSAGVIIPHSGFPTGVTSSTYSRTDVLTNVQETMLLAGLVYSNIHTSAFAGGEIRAQIVLGAASTGIYVIDNTYSGAQEVPPNNSAGTGTIKGAYNSTTNTIFYTINFSGLSSNASAAHFHAPGAPGVIAPVVIPHAGFPTGVTSGTYFKSDILTDLQETYLLSGLMYSNIHTSNIPGGEIRAQLTPFTVPVITCPSNITVSNDQGQCGASVAFIATATGTPAPTFQYKIGSTVITSPHTFAVETTTVTAVASNSAGIDSCTFNVTVNDTESPVISNLSASPSILWPPNHKMRDVVVNYTSSDNCGIVTCAISVTSDEPSNGNGGNGGPDWEVVNNHNVKLRAERDGNGNGRDYTLTVTCTDQSGNSSSAATIVSVPHSMSVALWENINEQFNSGKISISVLPNPSSGYFSVNIQTVNTEDKIMLNVFDASGRLVESVMNLPSVKTLQVGQQLKPGIYIMMIHQGYEVSSMRVLKL